MIINGLRRALFLSVIIVGTACPPDPKPGDPPVTSDSDVKDDDGDPDDTQVSHDTGTPEDTQTLDDTGTSGDTQDSHDSQASPDADGDGYTTDEDCDDGDPSVYPGVGAEVAADGIDNDCDGRVDEDPLSGRVSHLWEEWWAGETTSCAFYWDADWTRQIEPCDDCDWAFEVELSFDEAASSYSESCGAPEDHVWDAGFSGPLDSGRMYLKSPDSTRWTRASDYLDHGSATYTWAPVLATYDDHVAYDLYFTSYNEGTDTAYDRWRMSATVSVYSVY